jgi:two-component sensor histidine kinase
VTLAELLQNAVEHAFGEKRPHGRGGKRKSEPGRAGTGRVRVVLHHDSEHLSVDVRDDGVGLPKGFDIERTSSLGLSIVRDLVVSQLAGSIELATVPTALGGGTLARISVPLR